MKTKFALKTGFAAVAIAAASAANAGFYLNNGIDFGSIGVVNDKVCATCTSVKSELQFKYDSTTTIYDTNNNGIGAGDGISTIGGFAVPGALLGNNQITNFLPAPSPFGTDSNNGYGSNMILSFRATNLNGVVTGVSSGVPTFAYGAGGLIELLYMTSPTTYINFMDILLTDGGATGVSTILHGTVDFTNIDAGATAMMKNLFHSSDFSCGGSSSFYDIWSGTGCGAAQGGITIGFKSTQDANVEVSKFAYSTGANGVAGGGDDFYKVSTNHNGSASFEIPEPGSLALLGLGLAGLGLVKRRRNLAK